MVNNTVEENLAPMDVIVSNIFYNKRLTIHEFEFLKININNGILNVIMNSYYLRKIPNSYYIKFGKKNPKDHLKEVILCRIDDLPMYVNSFCKEIIKWRCTYNM